MLSFVVAREIALAAAADCSVVKPNSASASRAAALVANVDTAADTSRLATEATSLLTKAPTPAATRPRASPKTPVKAVKVCNDTSSRPCFPQKSPGNGLPVFGSLQSPKGSLKFTGSPPANPYRFIPPASPRGSYCVNRPVVGSYYRFRMYINPD